VVWGPLSVDWDPVTRSGSLNFIITALRECEIKKNKGINFKTHLDAF